MSMNASRNRIDRDSTTWSPKRQRTIVATIRILLYVYLANNCMHPNKTTTKNSRYLQKGLREIIFSSALPIRVCRLDYSLTRRSQSSNFHAFQFRIYIHISYDYIFSHFEQHTKHTHNAVVVTCCVLRSRPKYVAVDDSFMFPARKISSWNR